MKTTEKMEKITKEELQKNLFGVQLSDDELENASGGFYGLSDCENECIRKSNNSFEEEICLQEECN